MSESTGESGSAESTPTNETVGRFGFLSPETTKRAWFFWESVKSNPTVLQTMQMAQTTVQHAQKRAQEAWNQYDSETFKQKLGELGKSAADYIDEADRKLETMENGAVGYIQQRGTEIVEKVKEATGKTERSGEVLFSQPERKPISRLDAELMALNSSPMKIHDATAKTTSSKISESDRQQLLKQSQDLQETFASLVPDKLTESEFWVRYSTLREELKVQDARRKQLIEQPGDSADDLDDWGSSDEEAEANKKDDKTLTEKMASSGSSDAPHKQSDDDVEWE